jgi:hypothetical protein
MKHLHLSQPAESAVAEHIMNMGHDIKFYSIYKTGQGNSYMDYLVKDPTEIQLHPTNFNREISITLRKAWQPLTNLFQQTREASN